MTNQEIFNKAYIGLASQGFEQSTDEDGTCLYRSTDGKKCAIGWCISDKDYDPSMEGKPSDFLPIALFGEEVDHNFLNGLQVTHDENCDPEEMRKALDYLAHIHNLTVPNLEYEV